MLVGHIFFVAAELIGEPDFWSVIKVVGQPDIISNVRVDLEANRIAAKPGIAALGSRSGVVRHTEGQSQTEVVSDKVAEFAHHIEASGQRTGCVGRVCAIVGLNVFAAEGGANGNGYVLFTLALGGQSHADKKVLQLQVESFS